MRTGQTTEKNAHSSPMPGSFHLLLRILQSPSQMSSSVDNACGFTLDGSRINNLPVDHDPRTPAS